MLDDRKTAILRAVVQEYIATAQPVGSGHVAAAPGVGVSPATVRNEMAVLEQEGYLVQPHTSAGRIPTEKGYRVFVDALTPTGRLDRAEAQAVRSFFATAQGELEQMLARTSQLLADLTHSAAVVVAPPHEAATIRSAQLVALGTHTALLVLVLSNGSVEKHTLDLGRDLDPDDAADASARLAALLVGHTVAEVAALTPEPRADASADLVAGALAVLRSTSHEGHREVFVGGTSRVAASFDAVTTVSEVLHVLEHQVLVVSLLRGVLDRGLSVAIGSETGMAVADCAVVVAPYEVDGELAGTIGVLGPARMDYPQALAAVAVVSERLGRRLTEG